MPKTMLLPLPHKAADELSLQHHLTLHLLSGENATERDFGKLGQLAYLTIILADKGIGDGDPSIFEAANDAVVSCAARAKETGRYQLSEVEYEAFAAVLTLHDVQLGTCPVHMLEKANQELHTLMKS